MLDGLPRIPPASVQCKNQDEAPAQQRLAHTTGTCNRDNASCLKHIPNSWYRRRRSDRTAPHQRHPQRSRRVARNRRRRPRGLEPAELPSGGLGSRRRTRPSEYVQSFRALLHHQANRLRNRLGAQPANRRSPRRNPDLAERRRWTRLRGPAGPAVELGTDAKSLTILGRSGWHVTFLRPPK